MRAGFAKPRTCKIRYIETKDSACLFLQINFAAFELDKRRRLVNENGNKVTENFCGGNCYGAMAGRLAYVFWNCHQNDGFFVFDCAGLLAFAGLLAKKKAEGWRAAFANEIM